MSSKSSSKPSGSHQWEVRCQQRSAVRRKIYQCFCENREVPRGLLAKVMVLNIFGRRLVDDEQAIAYINHALSVLNREQQKKDKLLFQCWFVVGRERFKKLLQDSRIARELSSGTRIRRDVLSISYHMTGRRCGSKGHVASCPRMPCRC
jgi:hypothetical protein